MFETLFESVHTNLVRSLRFLQITSTNLLPEQAKGDDRPSLSATLIREAERHQLSMRENSWLAGTM